ncbi:MAG: hypothetical protein AAGD35_17615 [Actinomycetota bacterium]
MSEESTDAADTADSIGDGESGGRATADSTGVEATAPEAPTADSATAAEQGRAVMGTVRPLTGPEMTLSPRNPEGGWGHLSIDRAVAATTLAGMSAADGHQLLVVDYHVIAMTGGILGRENFSTAATFRVRAEDAVYPPIGAETIVTMQEGRTVNGQLVFELPVSADVVVLEAGVDDPTRSGFQSQVEIELRGDVVVPPAVAPREVEAAVISPADPPSGSTPGCPLCRAEIAVAEAFLTPKIEQVAAREGYVFLQAIVALNVTETERFFDAFTADNVRLQVGDEWFPAMESVIENYGEGERGRWPLTFEVPADVEQARLAFGPHEPHVEPDAATAYVEITFPSAP